MSQRPQPDTLSVPSSGLAFERFDEKPLLAFYERSNSAETRRAYRRVTREFFQYFKWRHPRLISSNQIAEWRDKLKEARQKPATVVFKLSVVRSLYEYLRDEGIVACLLRTCRDCWLGPIGRAPKGRGITRSCS
jgi:integrase